MRGGTLRHRVTLMRPTDGDPGDAGNASLTFVESGNIWSRIEPLTVAELLNAQQVQANATHKVTIRYHKEIAQKWQLLFRGRTFDVEAILPTDMRPIEMVLLVSEKV